MEKLEKNILKTVSSNLMTTVNDTKSLNHQDDMLNYIIRLRRCVVDGVNVINTLITDDEDKEPVENNKKSLKL